MLSDKTVGTVEWDFQKRWMQGITPSLIHQLLSALLSVLNVGVCRQTFKRFFYVDLLAHAGGMDDF